jgi:hypothetical protein
MDATDQPQFTFKQPYLLRRFLPSVKHLVTAFYASKGDFSTRASKMFEHRTRPLLPRKIFVLRVLRSLLLALGIIGFSLGLGILGYHFCAGLSWLDALLNASMILTGMGPVNELHTVAAKLFASFYALFSGVVFITSVALLLTPVIHRLLHKFHLEAEGAEEDRKEQRQKRDK